MGEGFLLKAEAAQAHGQAAESKALLQQALPGLRAGLGQTHPLTIKAESMLRPS